MVDNYSNPLYSAITSHYFGGPKTWKTTSSIPKANEVPASQPNPDFGSAFDAMEQEINGDLPEGAFVTLRSGANAPRYAPLMRVKPPCRSAFWRTAAV